MKAIFSLVVLILSSTSHASNKATASDCSSTDGRYHSSGVAWSSSSASIEVVDGKHFWTGVYGRYVENTSRILERHYREGRYAPIEDTIHTYDTKLSITSHEPDPQNPDKNISVERDYGVKTLKCRSMKGDSRDISYFGKALEFTNEPKKLRPAMAEILARFPRGGPNVPTKINVSTLLLSLVPVLSYEEQKQGLEYPSSLVFKDLKVSVATRTQDPDEYFDIKFVFQNGDIVQLNTLDTSKPYCQLVLKNSTGSILKSLQGELELNGSNPITYKDATTQSAPGLNTKIYYVDLEAKEKSPGQYSAHVLCFPDMTIKQMTDATGGKISVQLNSVP